MSASGSPSTAEVMAMIQAATDPETIATQQKEHKEKTMATEDLHALLAERMGETRSQSAVVTHKDPANKVSLAENMTNNEGIRILKAEEEAQNQTEEYYFPLNMRWEDGAVALPRVLEEIWGASGVGQRHYSFFGGSYPPAKVDVVVGVRKLENGEIEEITETVPGSEFFFAPLEAKIDWSQRNNGDDSGLFMLRVEIKVKNKTSASYIAKAIEQHVRQHSIYKGHVLRYVNDGQNDFGVPQYHLQHVWREEDPSIVYSAEAGQQLRDEVLGRITGSRFLRARGLNDTFKVLVYGPLGTGKSAFLVKTACVAREHGRTVIEYNPQHGVDVNELLRVNEVAKKFGDTVVLIEDVDQFYPVSPYALSLMTNLMDGSDKTSRVSYLMTTNHLENVEPEMTRPPRLTGVIKVAELDRASIEEMFRRTLGDSLAEDVDFDQIWSIVSKFSPSFIRTGFDKALMKQVQEGRGDEKLTTEDLVFAARSLVHQNDVHVQQVKEKEGRKTNHLLIGLRELYQKVTGRTPASD